MRSLALITILALSLAACGGGSGTPAGGTGTLKVMVTDAPFPGDHVETATVVIKRVEARNADLEGWQILFDGDAEDAPRDENGDLLDEDADGVPDSYAELNLVELTGGITALLVEIEVPEGSYDEIRLIVDAGTVAFKEDAYVVSTDAYPESHTYTVDNGRLTFPSGAQTGIKVKIDEPVVVTTGLSADLTLDFDLSKNFLLHGSPEYAPGVKWVKFTPVARAVNNTTAGTLAFTVKSDDDTPEDATDNLPIASPTVFVKQDGVDEITGDPTVIDVATVTGAADGTVSVALAAGTYRLVIEAAGHDTLSLPLDGDPDIVVVLANVTDLGDVLLNVAVAELAGQVMNDMGTPGDDADDEPLAGVTVTVLEVGGVDPLFTTTTDSNGSYRFSSGLDVFSGLMPGMYDVRFEIDTDPPTHATLTMPSVDVQPAIPTYLDVTLEQLP